MKLKHHVLYNDLIKYTFCVVLYSVGLQGAGPGAQEIQETLYVRSIFLKSQLKDTKNTKMDTK